MNLKKSINNIIIDYWKNKQFELENQLKNLESSLFNESKSSAGDKYETSRAMIHLEKEKLDLQLINVLKNIEITKKINIDTAFKVSKIGSLILANEIYFYIGSTAPKLTISGKEIYCISAESPLAKQIIGKKIGDFFDFNQNKLQIISIE